MTSEYLKVICGNIKLYFMCRFVSLLSEPMQELGLPITNQACLMQHYYLD